MTTTLDTTITLNSGSFFNFQPVADYVYLNQSNSQGSVYFVNGNTASISFICNTLISGSNPIVFTCQNTTNVSTPSSTNSIGTVSYNFTNLGKKYQNLPIYYTDDLQSRLAFQGTTLTSISISLTTGSFNGSANAILIAGQESFYLSLTMNSSTQLSYTGSIVLPSSPLTFYLPNIGNLYTSGASGYITFTIDNQQYSANISDFTQNLWSSAILQD